MCSFNHVLKNLMYHVSGCQTLTINKAKTSSSNKGDICRENSK